MSPEIYVLHYQPNIERKRYLDEMFALSALEPDFIVEFDREVINLERFYRFDERLFLTMVEPIWPVLVGYVVGLGEPNTVSWSSCVADIIRSGTTTGQALSSNPWLQPKRLKAADVSVFLKHQHAWKKLAQSSQLHAIVAEDDIIFRERTGPYLRDLLGKLPEDIDFADIAGGCNLVPRIHNERVNDSFFRIEPPRDRTCCAYIMSKNFARRLLDLNPPMCLPIDWTLTYAFKRLAAHVYWVEPTPFGHGSMMGVYRSHSQV